MALSTMRTPRSFAGDKAAPLDEFFNSMAHAVARGDPNKKAEIARFCARVNCNLAARAVFDVGGLMKFARSKMITLLTAIELNSEHWVETLEDVLDFEFKTPVPLAPPQPHWAPQSPVWKRPRHSRAS